MQFSEITIATCLISIMDNEIYCRKGEREREREKLEHAIERAEEKKELRLEM